MKFETHESRVKQYVCTHPKKLNVRSVLSPSAYNATRTSEGEAALIQNDGGDVASLMA
jgi:hypothetical protein